MARETSRVASTWGVAEEGRGLEPKMAEVPIGEKLEAAREFAEGWEFCVKIEEVPIGVWDWEFSLPKATLEEKVRLDITGLPYRVGSGDTGTEAIRRLFPA